MAFWRSLVLCMFHVEMEKIGPLLAGLFVCPPWVWLAVRTDQCFRIITGHSIPFRRQTIWLIKILALIVGAGNVAGVLIGIGTPWFVASFPAAIVIFFALRDKVSEIVPPKPPQDPYAYESAWEEYDRLRASFRHSWLGFIGVSVTIALVALAAEQQSRLIQFTLFAGCAVALLVWFVMMNIRQWKWLRWRCPRCGCSFRGQWRFWLPKNCVYCGLPRRDKGTNLSSASQSNQFGA
jgi:hypothetical protein